MMTPVRPRLLNMITDFVLLRFWARAPEDLSAIEVIYVIIIIIIEFLGSSSILILCGYLKIDSHCYHGLTYTQLFKHNIIHLSSVWLISIN